MQSSWWVEFRNYCGFENFGITLIDGEEIAGGAVVLKFLTRAAVVLLHQDASTS